MAEINYLLSVVKGDKVSKLYFAHSLTVLSAIRAKYPDSKNDAFDVSEYRMKFKDTPTVIADGSYRYQVRCSETNAIWASPKECAKEIGVPVETLYTAIRRGSALQGRHYLKIIKNKEK